MHEKEPQLTCGLPPSPNGQILYLYFFIISATCLTGCKPDQGRNIRTTHPSSTLPGDPSEPLAPAKSSSQSGSTATDQANQLKPKSCCTFPLKPPTVLGDFEGPNAGGRNFGALRSGGRQHAATDLLRDPETPIYAIADGTVLDYYFFYEGTNAVVVDHGQFVARYGEVSRLDPAIKIKSQIKKGQRFAFVGLLDYGASMLHLELYKGTLQGDLSSGSNSYRRRPDLFDPTSCVNLWMKKDDASPCWRSVPSIGGE